MTREVVDAAIIPAADVLNKIEQSKKQKPATEQKAATGDKGKAKDKQS
jgi:hypothetical protein